MVGNLAGAKPGCAEDSNPASGGGLNVDDIVANPGLADDPQPRQPVHNLSSDRSGGYHDGVGVTRHALDHVRGVVRPGHVGDTDPAQLLDRDAAPRGRGIERFRSAEPGPADEHFAVDLGELLLLNRG